MCVKDAVLSLKESVLKGALNNKSLHKTIRYSSCFTNFWRLFEEFQTCSSTVINYGKIAFPLRSRRLSSESFLTVHT